MNKKTRPTGNTTDLPLVKISWALQRHAVLPNPDSTSAIEEPLTEETPSAVFGEQEYQEEEYIQWKRPRRS